ncbi:gamma-glutamylcyclotransferase [Dissulfurirhabdus thermomarina]|uniref:Gamma-glutamylcyclotransferase n=1 Tax=Dissulfurirhabdus thermomarina TaxID=1765737 RepID=A0A6N9TK15_DISTH|nr:gamma-glutamylcyclotransferase family protein [Dissulfurirhabdus thermomarina]NDY41602.1 gamma-glutamylcyclotransferase [Dissulfurirhabdus thermomarina]
MDGERQPSKENTAGILRLFVYGTLKRGCWNHDRFCRGVLSVEEAVVRGRLYEMPSGIPVLQVPEEDILARGTADPLADVATQARFARDLASILEPVPESATTGDCGPVYGELLTFDDPETRLPAIDRLEGFHPGGPSLYRRVLVPVKLDGAAFPAWLYAGQPARSDRLLLPFGSWPP